jgi:hypothetical protein
MTMTVVVHNANDFIATVFNASGEVINPDVTIAFNLPASPPSVYGKTFTDALQALNVLTLQNGITVGSNSFSGISFTSLQYLNINTDVSGDAVFGSINGSSSASFPALLILSFGSNITLSGNALFGASSSTNATSTAASLPALQSVNISGNVTFSGDNAFGVTSSSTNSNSIANTFSSLVAINLQSSQGSPIMISGNQFFGALSSNNGAITPCSFPVLPFVTLYNGLTVSGGQLFGSSGGGDPTTFPVLQTVYMGSGVNIIGANAFNNIRVSSGTTALLQANGCSYPSTTFNVLGGVTSLNNLSGSTGTINRITGFRSGPDFVYNNRNYGSFSRFQMPSTSGVVTSIPQLLATIFDVSGDVLTTEITIAFNIPTTCYNDTTIVNGNGKRLRDVFQVLTRLTIGNSSRRIDVNTNAFSTTTALPVPFSFTNLTDLTLSNNVAFGNAAFGAYNTGSIPLQGALFPRLQNLTFGTGCIVNSNALFGAYSTGTGSTTAALMPVLQTINIQNNVQFKGDNVFGTNSTNSSAVLTANTFTFLRTFSFDSTSILISGSQFFGSSSTVTGAAPSAPILENLTFFKGLVITGNNSFANSNFPDLVLLAFQGGVNITGTNSFYQTAFGPQTDVCIQSDGITYPSSTFNVIVGGTINLTNLNGSTGQVGQIIFAVSLGLPNFIFDRQDYGACTNAPLPHDILYVTLTADSPSSLIQNFVALVNEGNTDIQFMNDVPELFWLNTGVAAACAQLTNLSFGPGIKINNQAFGYHSGKTSSSTLPVFSRLLTLTFSNGCVVAGDQVFGIFANTYVTQSFPILNTITFEDNVQIVGDDLFGTSASGVNGLTTMYFPSLTSLTFGNNMTISGNRVLGAANYTSGTAYGAEMPALTTFSIGDDTTISGSCFMGALVQYQSASQTPPTDNGGFVVGARAQSLTSFTVGQNVSITGECFCGAASPSGGEAIGAIFDQLETLSLGDKITLSGGQAFGSSESNTSSFPTATALGSICPRLAMLAIGASGNLSGTASFSASRSGNPQSEAIPPTFGTPLPGNGGDSQIIELISADTATVNLLNTIDFANIPAIQTGVSLGRGTSFTTTTFGFQSSGSNPSPALSLLQGASSNGASITLVNQQSISLASSYSDGSQLITVSTTNNATTTTTSTIISWDTLSKTGVNILMLILCWTAFLLAVWTTAIVSGP